MLSTHYKLLLKSATDTNAMLDQAIPYCTLLHDAGADSGMKSDSSTAPRVTYRISDCSCLCE